MNSGYSNTPLAKKLGLKEDFSCYIIDAPKTYSDCIHALEISLKFFTNLIEKSINFIHIFCKSEEKFQLLIKTIIPKLKFYGLLWVSWPKGRSKLITDLKKI